MYQDFELGSMSGEEEDYVNLSEYVTFLQNFYKNCNFIQNFKQRLQIAVW